LWLPREGQYNAFLFIPVIGRRTTKKTVCRVGSFVRHQVCALSTPNGRQSELGGGAQGGKERKKTKEKENEKKTKQRKKKRRCCAGQNFGNGKMPRFVFVEEFSLPAKKWFVTPKLKDKGLGTDCSQLSADSRADCVK